jgi:hypothetical protein
MFAELLRVGRSAPDSGSAPVPTASRSNWSPSDLRSLPEWTEWCAQQSGISASLAAPSIAAARSTADALDKQDPEDLPDPADTTPFRHQE